MTDPIEVMETIIWNLPPCESRAEATSGARAVLAALAAAGLKVLPEEPTSAMMAAAGWFDENTPPRYTTRGVWSRMWNAA